MKLGIIGGFGGYATLGFFERILQTFESPSERSYPHIIMDNNFQMPSRTRALLTGGGRSEVVYAIANSMKLMLREHVDYIVMVCGTAHAFLPDVYQIVPEAEDKVLHMIHLLGAELQTNGIDKVLVLAAEGILFHKLYSKLFAKYQISCVEPDESSWPEIRSFIEMVKRNKYPVDAADKFLKFTEKYNIRDIVMGCTEFPVFIETVRKNSPKFHNYQFHDPLNVVLTQLKLMSLR